MTSDWEVKVAAFADNELGRSEEHEVLSQCEMRPELYRDLVLAVCESRRWATALGGLENNSVQMASLARKDNRRMWSGTSLAIAAGLMLVVGLVGGHFLSGSGDLASGPANATQSTDGHEPYFVLLNVPSQEADQATQLANQYLQPYFQPIEREILRRHGYEIEEHPVLYVVEDDEGNKLAIPQRNFDVRYVSN